MKNSTLNSKQLADDSLDSYLCIQFWDRDTNEWREATGHRFAYLDDLEAAKKRMAVLEADNKIEKYRIVNSRIQVFWPWKPFDASKRSDR